MTDVLELRVARDGSRVRLLAPDVGWFTARCERGALLGPGAVAGELEQLGLRRALVVPAGVEGRVVVDPPERTRAPVGYGDVVVELETLVAGESGAGGASAGGAAASGVVASAGGRSDARAAPAGRGAATAAGPLVVRAASSGRYWHRPGPGEPPHAAPGTVLRDGAPIGLLEVMKTFGPVFYRAGGELPPEARVVEVLAADGADVRRGDALLAVEPVR